MKRNLHVMSNSGAFPNKFVPDYARLVAKEINTSNNDFLILGDDSKVGSGFSYEVESLGVGGAIRFCLRARHYSKVIFHSIPSRYLLLFVLLRPLAFRSVSLFMVLWGGEVHFLDGRSAAARRAIRLNNLFMRGMDGFVTYLESDYRKAVRMSGNRCARWVNIQGFYPSNVVAEIPSVRSDSFRIMMGVSALERNRHFELIDRLSVAHMPDMVEFVVPLSYGNKEYATRVFEYAKERLPGKVIPLFDFMALDEYLGILASMDAAIFMNDGQQGMGNIRNLLSFGAQVFMSAQSESYVYFKGMGFDVFPVDDLALGLRRRVLSENIALARKEFSREALLVQMDRFLGGG